MFQSTPSAKTEWRQENGYSQQKMLPKEKTPFSPPPHPRIKRQAPHVLPPSCPLSAFSSPLPVASSILAGWLTTPPCLAAVSVQSLFKQAHHLSSCW